MVKKLWKDVWAAVQGIPPHWNDATDGTVETLKTVSDIAKALDENKAAKELAPLVGRLSSLLDVLNSPLVQVVSSGLPFVSIGAGVLKFYLEATRKEPTLEMGVAVVSQAAYLESLRLFLEAPENALLKAYWNAPASETVAKQIKALGEHPQLEGVDFELDEREAESALVCFHKSKLAALFNQALRARLQDAGMPPDLATTATERVARQTHRYLKRAVADAGEAASRLARQFGDRWQRDLEIYRSLDDYQTQIIAQKPKEKVFNEDFGFEDIYVRLEVKPVDSEGRVIKDAASQDLEAWAMALLQDPEQAGRVLFIQGGPGRGKSVFCRMFADRVRRELHPIWTPILIRLRDIRGDGFDADFDRTLKVAVGTDFASEDNWLTKPNSRFLFLLDGFDELLLERGASQELQEFLDQVGLFQSRCAQLPERGHRVLITGRPLALHGIERKMPQNLARMEIIPMQPEVQQRWFGQWARLKGEEVAQNFQQFLEAENCPKQVQILAQEPLLLYLLASLHAQGRLGVELFSETDAVGVRIQIYEEALRGVLSQQRLDDNLGDLNEALTGFEPEDLRSILAEAGLCVVQSGGECASIAMIEERLKLKEDGTAQVLLEVAKTHTDVLKNALAVFYLKSAADAEKRDPKVEFFHKSFGEFLCAERFCESLVNWTEIKDSRRKTYHVSAQEMQKQIYDLFGFGSLTPEIVEYLMALLKQRQPDNSTDSKTYWLTLNERLKEFYWDWSDGKWIEALSETDEPLPLRQARWFQKRNIRLGQRQVDICTGLNILILLFQIHSYAQSRDDLKEDLQFHPCGQPDTKEFDTNRLLRIIGYSGCLKVMAFGEVERFLHNANLRGANLRGADLINADLSHAYLSHAYLSYAYLINADLSYAYLSHADLSYADLNGVRWNQATQWANARGLHQVRGIPEDLQQSAQFAAAVRLSQGIDLVQQGNVEAALEAYYNSQQIDPDLVISAETWNILCWYGSLHGCAEQVLFAGDHAVSSEPDNPRYKESRGLARALARDLSGALTDFQAALESGWLKDFKSLRQQRQRWVEALQRGENPFTPEELEELRSSL